MSLSALHKCLPHHWLVSSVDVSCVDCPVRSVWCGVSCGCGGHCAVLGRHPSCNPHHRPAPLRPTSRVQAAAAASSHMYKYHHHSRWICLYIYPRALEHFSLVSTIYCSVQMSPLATLTPSGLTFRHGYYTTSPPAGKLEQQWLSYNHPASQWVRRTQ